MTEQMQKTGKGQEPNPATSSFSDEVIISLSGVGDLLDVRFKIDPRMKTPGPIYIQDEATGTKLTLANVPKIGPLISGRTPISKGRHQPVSNCGFGLFLNMEEVVKHGSLVTFVSGGYRKEHIPVC